MLSIGILPDALKNKHFGTSDLVRRRRGRKYIYI